MGHYTDHGEKEYTYIPVLMDDIVSLLTTSSCRLKDKRVLDENHPKQQQSTIANVNPEKINEIVTIKQSRFG